MKFSISVFISSGIRPSLFTFSNIEVEIITKGAILIPQL
jgi:hypothetical protein